MKSNRYILLILIIALSLKVVTGQKVSFPLINGLKGSVRSIKEVCYKAEVKEDKTVKGVELKKSNYLLDTKNKLIEKNDYDSTGALIERYVANYDDYENPLEETQYTPDSILYKYKYRYDTKGNRIAWMSFTMVDTAIARGSYHYDDKGRIVCDTLFDAKGMFSKYDAYTFDEQDQLIKESHFSVRGIRTVDTYELDMEGRKIQGTKTGADGNTLSVSRFKYNNDDKLIQIDILTDSSDDYAPFQKYGYNESGAITEHCWFVGGKLSCREEISYDSLNTGAYNAYYGPDGKISKKELIKFDSYRNKIEDDIFKADTLFEKYLYQYDSKKNKTEVDYYQGKDVVKLQITNDRIGNPIKDVMYKNDQPVSITEREFVY